MREALAHGFRRQLGLTRRAAVNAVDTVLHPWRVPGQAIELTEVGRSLLRQLVVNDRARSPLWTGRRSLSRQFEVLTVDLDGLKAVSNKLGGTVNDGFVCGVAGGAGAYHRERGVEVDELRVSMPVNTRTDKSAGGNAFTPTRALVPAGTVDPDGTVLGHPRPAVGDEVRTGPRRRPTPSPGSSTPSRRRCS